MKSLIDKVAIVTGASSGIGHETAMKRPNCLPRKAPGWYRWRAAGRFGGLDIAFDGGVSISRP